MPVVPGLGLPGVGLPGLLDRGSSSWALVAGSVEPATEPRV